MYAKVKGTAGIGRAIAELKNFDSREAEIEYKHSPEAHALLNYKGRDELNDQTIKALVGFYAENGCGMRLPVKNAVIPIRFIRPINVKEGQSTTFYDGQDGGNELNIFGLVNFTDFRKDVVWKDAYYKYYGIVSITPDMDNIKSSMDNYTKKLKDYSPTTWKQFSYVRGGYSNKADIATTKAELTNAYGKLKYVNNGSLTSEFRVKVPLTIKYDWGTISQTVTITIKATK